VKYHSRVKHLNFIGHLHIRHKLGDKFIKDYLLGGISTDASPDVIVQYLHNSLVNIAAVS